MGKFMRWCHSITLNVYMCNNDLRTQTTPAVRRMKDMMMRVMYVNSHCSCNYFISVAWWVVAVLSLPWESCLCLLLDFINLSAFMWREFLYGQYGWNSACKSFWKAWNMIRYAIDVFKKWKWDKKPTSSRLFLQHDKIKINRRIKLSQKNRKQEQETLRTYYCFCTGYTPRY